MSLHRPTIATLTATALVQFNVPGYHDFARFLGFFYQHNRGLRNKTKDFYYFVNSCNYDIIMLLTTWVNSSTASCSIVILLRTDVTDRIAIVALKGVRVYSSLLNRIFHI